MRMNLRNCWLAALAGALLGLFTGVSEAQQVSLRGIVPYHPQNYLAQPLFIFQKMLDQKSGGQLKIGNIVGEEAVPALEQFDAVRNGVIDISLAVASYYTGTVPEAIGIQYNRKRVPTELRSNGFFELMRQIHLEKGNVVYLANASGTPGTAFRLYLKRSIAKPDLTGIKVRVSPVYTALVQGLNGTPVSMPPADTYAALERGVVDGLGWTYAGTMDYGFHEVAKHVIDHPFYSLNSAILMSRAAYDRLSDQQKKLLTDVSVEFEAEVEKYYADYIKNEDAKLKAAGVQFIKFSPEDAEKFVETAYRAGWADFLAKNPVNGPKLKALTE